MSLTSVGVAIQNLSLFTAVRESALVYPALLATHLACIATFGGLILATNLRLLGWAFTGVSAPEVIRNLRPWKWAGLVVMVGCGVLLGGSKASEYLPNPYFQLKMTLLACLVLHSLAFRRTVYRNPDLGEGSRVIPIAKRAAALSLALWISVASMGRWIAYYDAPAPAESAQATGP